MALCPVVGKLLHKRVVLASASPRRREILSNAGVRFEVVPSRFKEKLNKASFSAPYAYAVETAKQKALDVASRMHQKDLRAPDVVIGADTIVTVGGLILEKPVDKQDAYRMLSSLSGKEHSVFTGVAIVHCYSRDGQLDTDISEFYEETKVKFSELTEELLWEYIHSGEPMDKAGGYGIQALGGMLVEYIHGDFLNVVGFPLNHFCKKLAELYYPPKPEDVQRVKHDSIPTVDTFENPSDVEGGGSEPAQRNPGSGEGEGRGPCAPGAGGSLVEAEGDPRAQGTKEAATCNRTAETLPPFPADLLELIEGFKASKALFTACKLKVFDLLRDVAPQKAVDIAGHVDASLYKTEQLLDFCTALGILEKTEQGYSNTELANLYLVSDSEDSLHSFIMRNNDHTWNLFTRLEFAIREGTSQPHQALGKEAEDLFQDSHPQSKEMQLQFMRAMHGLTRLTAHQVATAFNLSWFTSACDLGGCTGALACKLAQEYPHLQVTVLDLPNVMEHASCFQPRGPEAAQISFVSGFLNPAVAQPPLIKKEREASARDLVLAGTLSRGDFFRDSLPRADLYILSRILHDLPDDRVHDLLSRVSGSSKPGGSLLVVEAVLDNEQAARVSLMQSLNTLVQMQGRQRSRGEYRRLLQQHGFCDVQVARVGDTLDVFLGTRAAP